MFLKKKPGTREARAQALLDVRAATKRVDDTQGPVDRLLARFDLALNVDRAEVLWKARYSLDNAQITGGVLAAVTILAVMAGSLVAVPVLGLSAVGGAVATAAAVGLGGSASYGAGRLAYDTLHAAGKNVLTRLALQKSGNEREIRNLAMAWPAVYMDPAEAPKIMSHKYFHRALGGSLRNAFTIAATQNKGVFQSPAETLKQRLAEPKKKKWLASLRRG